MKKFLTSTLFLIFAVSSLFAQEWETNFDQAQKDAHDQNKKLIMVFQGSDWCAPCMKLNREIWSSDTFKTYAKDHYVMMQVDFPRRKTNALPEAQQEQNAKLAETYNKKGFFPFVVVMNADGKVIGETGYKPISPSEYIEHLNSF